MQKTGFIGFGNMAQALAEGFLASGKIKEEELFAYAPHAEKLKENCGRIGVQAAGSLEELIREASLLIMACKPFQVRDVLKEADAFLKDRALVSIAAGWDHEMYEYLLGRAVRIQCIMPNTPAMVREGVFLFEETNSLKEEERRELVELFSSIGMVQELPTERMGIGGALTGCGPAFVDMLVEAYGDAAVKYGIKREDAYRLVSQMVLGSAKLLLETGKHPGVLKDEVCSPAGTTIAGVSALEEAGFRSACIRSIDAIMQKKKDG